MYKNCSECQKQFLYTTCSPQVWAWNFHVLNLQFNEQYIVILWVSWCKNKSFWQRCTCTTKCTYRLYVHIYNKFLCTLELKQWQVQFGTQILTRDLLLPCCCCLLPAVLYSFFRTLGLGPDLSHRYCPNADHMSHDFPAAAARSQLYLHRYVSEVRCV